MKYIKNPLHLLFWMIIGSIIGVLVSTSISELYRFLNDVFPSVFPSYDVTSNAKNFDTLYTSLWFISLIITLFITVYLSLRYDNLKFEYIITKTEGFYKIRTVLPTYVSNFGKVDVVSSIVSGLIFTIPFIFIPIQFIKNNSFLATLTEPYKMMSESFGYILSPIVMITLILLSYSAAIPLVLKYYRARWFSAFSEV